MYQFSYAEVLDETPKGARERERLAIAHSIELLEAAEQKGVRSREAIEAILFVRRLWAVFIEDLAELPTVLSQILKADDVVLTLGAGSIGAVAPTLPRTLANGDSHGAAK